MYCAALFDLDGTLVETTPEYQLGVLSETLEKLGRKAEASFRDAWNNCTDRERTIRETFGVEPADFWREYVKFEHDERRKDHVKAYEDVRVVRQLHEAGLKIGVVTGASPPIVEVYKPFIHADCIDAIVVAQDRNGIRGKPHPEGVYRCMALLGVTARETAFFGNGPEDVLAAQAAGVLPVLVDRGDYKPNGVKPAHHIYSLYEAQRILGL
ncbi:HAD hydrolase-like protein [Candidatus Woesearchaeota archaeon]|nr:HAD hydrolase-like protein [Candidatus Woesearchaeota archaeon]